MKEYENKLGISLSVLGILIMLYVSFYGLTHTGLWYDEIYSIWLVNLPLNEFFAAIVQDVHPPLYYLIYKSFIAVFNLLNVNNTAFVGVVVSLTPIYLLIVLALSKLRKNFGMLITGLFIFSIATMPMLTHYALEIRMYSWTTFFITASFIYIYEIIKKPTFKNWSILTFLTVCSSYTQYFSLLSSVILYLLFLAYIVRKNKSLLKGWLLSSAACVIAYLPWLPIAYSQFTTGQGGYWIPKITIVHVIGYIYQVISPLPPENLRSIMSFSTVIDVIVSSQYMIVGMVLFVVFSMIILYLIIIFMKNKDNITRYAYSGILAFILLPAIGIVVSYIFFPIFVARYLLPLLGVFWLSISILVSNMYNKNKKIFAFIVAIILIVGSLSVTLSLGDEQKQFNDSYNNEKRLHEVIGSNDIVIFDNNTSYRDIGSYYLASNEHYMFSDNLKVDSNKTLYYITSNPTPNLHFKLLEVKLSNINLCFKNYTVYKVEL